MLELVDQFNSEHDNIDVDMVTMLWVPDFYQKTPAAVAAGEGPTVAIMHVHQLALNAERGVIAPLDEVAQALGLRESDFAPVAGTRGSTPASGTESCWTRTRWGSTATRR